MRYANLQRWEKVLREEGIFVSRVLIKDRLNRLGIKGIYGGIDAIGRELAYYAEVEVRRACHDALSISIQADKSGFCEKDGIRYGTINALSKALGISSNQIRKRIKSSTIQANKGRVINGNVVDFYSESEVRILCTHLLEDFPQADRTGFFERSGVRYGTANALYRAFGISFERVVKLIKFSNAESIKGKASNGNILDFYSTDLFKKLLELAPEIPESGFIEKDGVRYGTINALGRALGLGIGNEEMAKVLKSLRNKSLQGRDEDDALKDLYDESSIKSLFAEFLAIVPHADEDGFIEKEGGRYGTLNALSKFFGFSSAQRIISRLKTNPVKSIKGKMKGGQIHDFYPESDVRSACADLIVTAKRDPARGKRRNPKAA